MESHSICDAPAKSSTQLYEHDLKVKVSVATGKLRGFQTRCINKFSSYFSVSETFLEPHRGQTP